MGQEPTISITLNGERRTIATGSTLLLLLAELGRDPRTVAVEYNGTILGREEFASVRLGQDDRLEVVHFVQGGCGHWQQAML